MNYDIEKIKNLLSKGYIRKFHKKKIISFIEQLQQENNNIKEIEEAHHQLNGNLINQNKELTKKYNLSLSLLIEYDMPCEKDNFMNKNSDYCEKICGCDNEIYKKCWDKFIEDKLSKGEKDE